MLTVPCSIRETKFRSISFVHKRGTGRSEIRKSKIGFSNLKESEIQDLLDHGATKEPKNPLWNPLKCHDPKDLELICLVKKRKICFQILQWIFLKKRTLSQMPRRSGNTLRTSVK